MNDRYPRIQLRKLLRQVSIEEKTSLDSEYRILGIRWYAQGLFIKSNLKGTEIKATTLFRVKPGLFIYSRLFAWKGSFAIVPDEFDGCYVSGEFPLFEIDLQKINPKYLEYFFKMSEVWDIALQKSSGISVSSRNRLKVEKFLDIEIPLPPLDTQSSLVQNLMIYFSKIETAKTNKQELNVILDRLLKDTFFKIVQNAKKLPMKNIAPHIRRPVKIDINQEYPELGIRSFGNGTFHKTAVDGATLLKKLFKIEPEDLVFNNVFAWEGAVAVAHPEDKGRFGSHRFITCVPMKGVTTSNFLKFYFLTPEGLKKLGDASPGGALRNRTLGLKSLENIEVPIPDINEQLWFDHLHAKIEEVKQLQSETETQIAALIPSILNRTFMGG
jgi:type I restriction enzyme S subunit